VPSIRVSWEVSLVLIRINPFGPISERVGRVDDEEETIEQITANTLVLEVVCDIQVQVCVGSRAPIKSSRSTKSEGLRLGKSKSDDGLVLWGYHLLELPTLSVDTGRTATLDSDDEW